MDTGQGMDPFLKRTYTRCSFIGPYGQFDQHAVNGRCAWVRFIEKEAAQ